MKKARFTEEQMVKILREADKAPVAEVARNIGSATRRSMAGLAGATAAVSTAGIERSTEAAPAHRDQARLDLRLCL